MENFNYILNNRYFTISITQKSKLHIATTTNNIWSLRSSQLLMFDFHIVAGIVQIAGHIRSLYYGFHMIDGIVTMVTIAAVAALVVSINFLRSLTIVHDRYDRRDRLWFYPSDRDRCDRWRSLAKWKFGFRIIVTIAEQFTSDPSDRERSPTIIWKPGFSCNLKFWFVCYTDCVYALS